MKATALVLVAALLAAPVARADEAAQAQYDRLQLGVDDSFVWGCDCSVQEVVTTWQGNAHTPIGAPDFFRALGRDDLVEQVQNRELLQAGLIAGGIAIILATSIGAVALAAGDSSGSELGPVMALANGGALLGSGMIIGGALVDSNPVDTATMRGMADQHNQELKQRLGLSIGGKF
jgi:hypothetical protein